MTENATREALAEHEFFADLAPEYIDFVAEHAETVHLQPDHVLFREDKAADRFYLLKSGRVTIEIPAISGPALDVQTLEPGQILGWSWLIPPYRWSFQARAEEPTELLAFDGDAIRERCEREPAFGYEILKRFSALMSDRLKAARRKMMDEWNPPGFA